MGVIQWVMDRVEAIDPPSHFIAVTFAVASLAGCAPAIAPTRPTVSLRVRGGPPSATVVVDEETLGTFDFVASRGVALPPGVHHLTVTAEGYFPWDREVTAKEGSPPIRLDVAMTRIPD
jgi:hypothetical protein